MHLPSLTVLSLAVAIAYLEATVGAIAMREANPTYPSNNKTDIIPTPYFASTFLDGNWTTKGTWIWSNRGIYCIYSQPDGILCTCSTAERTITPLPGARPS